MPALEIEHSPLTICLERLHQTAGPPARPEKIAALAAMLHSDQSTLQSCSQLILQDLGLTLRLLRIANSPLFNPGGKTITSVTHASALLGMDALAQVVDTVPRQNPPHPARELAVLCQLTAVMARTLMGRLEPRYSEEAFVCGLFRNMGELTYALELPGDYQQVLADSQGRIGGLRESCQLHSHFDFDELSAGLLRHWGLHGAPALAAQSTPEALSPQSGNPEAQIALAASLAHIITSVYFRGDPSERGKSMGPCWGPLAKRYHMGETHMEGFCRSSLDSIAGTLARMGLTAERLRLREWMPAPEAAESLASVPAALPEQTNVSGLLQSAIDTGIDRAAWLPFADPAISLGASAGSGWPGEGPAELPQLIHPRKPPFLLAFGQRQDVWIDLNRDNRFRATPLALTLQPQAFFLLPVCDDRKVRGCLYFDWAFKRDFSPETLLPALSALRDHMATNIPAR